jgi:hypothetical protein
MMKPRLSITTTLAMTAVAALAYAQPSPGPNDPYGPQPAAGPPPSPSGPPSSPARDLDDSPGASHAHSASQPAEPSDGGGSGNATPAQTPPPPRPPEPPIDMPTLISAPTGWLLPAGIIYSRTGIDTGGGVTSDERVGLGDVAEFGVSSLDQVRACTGTGSASDCGNGGSALQPFFAATFRMGLGEDRLFDGQPGLVLGFRKSFANDSNGYTTRIAELTLVASRKLGTRVALHAGGAFWDASLENDQNGDTTNLHDRPLHSLSNQIRAFGGIQARPLDRAIIMVDLSWAPEFCYECGTSASQVNARQQIQLSPELAWGVRYEVSDWMVLESGVRVPDIQRANLLGAQIFGNATFVFRGLRHAIYGH